MNAQQPMTDGANALACSVCSVAMVPVQKTRISVGSVIEALVATVLMLIGIVLLFVLPLLGLVIVGIALVMWAIGDKKVTQMVCPSCGQEGREL